tara:strand:- start:8161 stop:9981 length:1821 start_codon:yes stop_codon:yes gene_type:complete
MTVPSSTPSRTAIWTPLNDEPDPTSGEWLFQYGDKIIASKNRNRSNDDLGGFENDRDITGTYLGKGLWREGAGHATPPLNTWNVKQTTLPSTTLPSTSPGDAITNPAGTLDDLVNEAAKGIPPVKTADMTGRTFGSEQQGQEIATTEIVPQYTGLLPNPYALHAAGLAREKGLQEERAYDLQAKLLENQSLLAAEQKVEKEELEGKFKEKVEKADLAFEYPGMTFDEITEAQAIAADESAPLAERSAAKRRLERAREVDSGRAYGSIFSKILAAVSIGLGAYSAKTTGRNFALEIFNKTIADDVASQKAMFLKKGQKADKVRNSYAHFMKEFNDESAAESAAIISTTNQALLSIQGNIARLGGGAEAAKMMDLYTTKQNQNIAASNKAAREFAEKEAVNRARTVTPIPGLRRTSPELQQQGIEIEKGWVKLDAAITEIEAAAGNIERVFTKYRAQSFAGVVTQIDNLVSNKSINIERAGVLKAELSGYYESLVNGIRKAKEMGVLQKFEREELDRTVQQPTAFDAWMKTKFNTPLGSATFARAFVLPVKQTLSKTMASMSSGSSPFYVFDKGRDPKTGEYRFKYDPAAIREEAEALSAGLRPGFKE